METFFEISRRSSEGNGAGSVRISVSEECSRRQENHLTL
jgi:hypothetical protein